MSDTFNVASATTGEWNLNGVAIRVNGEPDGNEPSTSTLADTVQRHAGSKGIKQASVFAGTRKLFASDGAKTLQSLSVTELNIVTKDQRAKGRSIWVL